MNHNHKTPAQSLKGDKRRMAMLDRALEGATAQQKARVYGVILRYGIETDDEFFIIFVAIGHLMALVEEAPQNWRALFNDFEGTLNSWAEQNLRTLKAIQQQANNTERMSTSFQALAKSTNSLSNEIKASLAYLTKLKVSLENSTAKLNRTEHNSQKLLDQFTKTDKKVERLETVVTTISTINWALIILMMVGGVLAHGQIVRQNQRMHTLLRREAQHSEWMLEKATRAECFSGVKPQGDPQCQQFQ